MRNYRKKQILTLTLILVAIFAISIGFSAFSSTLRITPQVNVTPDSSDFSVKFSTTSDSLTVGEVEPYSMSDGLTATSAIIDNSGIPTIKNMSAVYTGPGDYVTYRFYVRNDGEYIAYLNSITYNGGNACSGKEGTTSSSATSACNDIIMTVKVGEVSVTETTLNILDETLNPGESKIVEVTVQYSENGYIPDGDFSLEFGTVSLYYASTGGINEENSGDSGTLYTGIIYTNSTQALSLGHNMNNRWCAVVPGVVNTCVENEYYHVSFASKTECEEEIEFLSNSDGLDETMQQLLANATCEQDTTPLSYETTPLNINKNYYLKHEVINNVVTASYACITYTENGIRKDVCVRGGASYYESNTATLRSVEPYFNTLPNSSSSTGYGYCDFNDLYSDCYSDSLVIETASDGTVEVSARNDSTGCLVNSVGKSNCKEK